MAAGSASRVPTGATLTARRPESRTGGDHPVVQVSARDAAAFCAFHGLRLPDEVEWEFAARGRDGRRFPWGHEAPNGTGHRHANFGTLACCAPDAADGFLQTAPVGHFPGGASPFGMLDMAGNVWEWTSSPFPGREDQVALRGGGWGNNPLLPAQRLSTRQPARHRSGHGRVSLCRRPVSIGSAKIFWARHTAL